MNEPSKPLKITALSTDDTDNVLVSVRGRQITEGEVREIAEEGSLLKADGTISLLDYTAFLIEEYAKDA